MARIIKLNVYILNNAKWYIFWYTFFILQQLNNSASIMHIEVDFIVVNLMMDDFFYTSFVGKLKTHHIHK